MLIQIRNDILVISFFFIYYKKCEEKESKWKRDIKTGTKKLYLQFYKEIMEVMETLQDDTNIKGKNEYNISILLLPRL
jgi:hypothetical protein